MTIHSEESLVSDALHDLCRELMNLMHVEVSNLSHFSVTVTMIDALIAVVGHGLVLLLFLLFFILFVVVLARCLPG